MKAGDLKEVIAAAMLIDQSKVWVTMRNLRENDLLTTGARGVNAPDMTYLDAARVLLAHILNSNPGRAAPRLVRDFGAIPWENRDSPWAGDPFTFGELVPDSDVETLEGAIAALIRVFSECQGTDGFQDACTRLRDGTEQKPSCRIEVFEEDRVAQLVMAGAGYSYSMTPPRIGDWTNQDDERFRLGRQAIAFVNQEVVAKIADGFREGA